MIGIGLGVFFEENQATVILSLPVSENWFVRVLQKASLYAWNVVFPRKQESLHDPAPTLTSNKQLPEPVEEYSTKDAGTVQAASVYKNTEGSELVGIVDVHWVLENLPVLDEQADGAPGVQETPL
jgi:hypothetical protein